MEYLVIYMSRHGTTEKVALHLKERLGVDDVMLVNLEHEEVPDLGNFGTVIIGGSVHAGVVQDELTQFCHRYKDELLGKRLGLFMCFMNTIMKDEEFEESFPLKLRLHATATGLLGGEFLFERMTPEEQLAVNKNKGIYQSVYRLDQDAIENFLRDISLDSSK